MSATKKLEAALLAMKPEWAVSIHVTHQYNFDLSACYSDGFELRMASAHDCPSLADALAKVESERAKKLGKHDIAAAEVASWGISYASDWTPTALQFEREGVN